MFMELRSDSLQAVATLQTLTPGDYHVTLISPDTFTTFTPLLPCKPLSELERRLFRIDCP